MAARGYAREEVLYVPCAAITPVFIAEVPVEGMGFGAAARTGDLHGDAVKPAGCFLGGIDKPAADTLPAACGGNDERHDAPPAPVALQIRDRGHRDDPHDLPLEFGNQGNAGCLAFPHCQAPPDYRCGVIGIPQLDEQRGHLWCVAGLGWAD